METTFHCVVVWISTRHQNRAEPTTGGWSPIGGRSNTKQDRESDAELARSSTLIWRQEAIESIEGEVIDLHLTVFSAHSEGLAYDGGLAEDALRRHVRDPSFQKVAAVRDGRVDCFGILTANIEGVSWLNPTRIGELVTSESIAAGGRSIIPIVLLVISAHEDAEPGQAVRMGHLSRYLIKQRWQEEHGSESDGFLLISELTAESVHYTPQLIHASMRLDGYQRHSALVEVNDYGVRIP